MVDKSLREYRLIHSKEICIERFSVKELKHTIELFNPKKNKKYGDYNDKCQKSCYCETCGEGGFDGDGDFDLKIQKAIEGSEYPQICLSCLRKTNVEKIRKKINNNSITLNDMECKGMCDNESNVCADCSLYYICLWYKLHLDK